MKYIKLNKNRFAQVDDEDFDWINDLRRWQVNNFGYAQLNQPKYGRSFMMHRLIMLAKKGQMIDHINGDKLDNRKANLRFANYSQNAQNKGKQKGSYFSKFKGVVKAKIDRSYKNTGWQKTYIYFSSVIKNKNKAYRLSTFKSEHHAALMYDFWALELHGKFAKTNFKIEKHNFF